MDDSPLPTFGDVLRTLRLARGYSQRSLARLAGLDSTYISRLESGAYHPSKVPTVHRLARALELDAEEEATLIEASGRLPVGLRLVARPDRSGSGGSRVQRTRSAASTSSGHGFHVAQGTTLTDRMDPEVYAFQQIRDALGRCFPAEALRDVVAAVLVSRGYEPEPSSGGLDFVAVRPREGGAPATMYVFVRVAKQADLETLHNLRRAAVLCEAERAMLVCWEGFTPRAVSEMRHTSWVALLDADGITRAFLEEYDRLPGPFRERIPLKRIWALNQY